MHQSWMLFIHWLYVLTQFSGTKVTSPLCTASTAFWAMDLPLGSWSLTLLIATNHWSVSMGSTTWPVRAQIGSISLCGFDFQEEAFFFQISQQGFARRRSGPCPGRHRSVVR
jgi:hypothetical protein